MHRLARAAAAAALLACGAAAAQDRPSEEELFGAPGARQEPVAPSAGRPGPKAPADGQRPREEDLFGAPPAEAAPPPAAAVSKEKEDPLRVGGQLYLRATTGALDGDAPADWALSSPNLMDVYLDVRPNDRVRGFVLGRMFYDPTLGPGTIGAVRVTGTGASALLAAVRPPANPQAVLDQLWVNFDVERTVFVTAGRQHAKWGVGRFWNPTDYLHPVRRNPLDVFDVRTGVTMVKLHLPWEARGWNLYGVGMLEDVAGETLRRADGSVDGTNRMGRVGGGARAEAVLGTVEVGADALLQHGHRPRFGVDVSAGVWDLDVYAEAALRTRVDTPRWRAIPGAPATLPATARYERHDPDGFTPQITAGTTYSVKYSDEDAVTFGAEYFYDRSGYDSASIYPALLAMAFLTQVPTIALPGGTVEPNPLYGEKSPFTSFYLGRHYAGAFVSLPAPGRWNDTTFTLTGLGNLSDRSFVVRLDHSVLALTYLRVETFVAGHAGRKGGEFRLAFDAPDLGMSFRAPVLEAGVALRVGL